CSDCFRLERLPGGACTHWKAPPLHGAHPERTFQLLNFCANIGLVIIKKGRALEGDFLCPS
ncbi:hypothetical protein, partial [Bradyrhizobium sp. CCBAU 51745]|uniref:hypothetical protein n=1 Tax=Bradyrhizobium sp. CCBAU 51745 TaxID=1325099 RepID=UPI0023063C32